VIRLLLIVLLVLFVARAVWRLLSGVVEGATAAGPRRPRTPERGTRMVRDPICGTFVVQSRALSADSRGETAWFCSEDCRRKWQVGRRSARAD
jgi:YHS domain-containing protein